MNLGIPRSRWGNLPVVREVEAWKPPLWHGYTLTDVILGSTGILLSFRKV